MNKRSAAPLVDVVVPVFNAAQTVEASLRSMCNQTVTDIRVIVVDDGSTDDTPHILRRMAHQDERIEIITTANRGIVDALNTAFEVVRADLVARFDADDIAYPNRLAVQCDYLRRHPQCVAVGCNVWFSDDNGERTGKASNFPHVVPSDPFHAPAGEPYLLHPFLLVRREAMERAGPYRHAFHSEDADLYWRLGDTGELINLSDVLGEYRVHAGSISSLSVLNGRISAVNSQLAAVSEQRRRAGKSDVVFERSTLAEYKSARDLDKIIAIASRQLSADEAAYLSIATATKLLELSSYRPYRLESSDFETIRAIISRQYGQLKHSNRMRLIFRQVLLPNGLRSLSELLRLMPWRVFPRAVVELFAYGMVRLRQRALRGG